MISLYSHKNFVTYYSGGILKNCSNQPISGKLWAVTGWCCYSHSGIILNKTGVPKYSVLKEKSNKDYFTITKKWQGIFLILKQFTKLLQGSLVEKMFSALLVHCVHPLLLSACGGKGGEGGGWWGWGWGVKPPTKRGWGTWQDLNF